MRFEAQGTGDRHYRNAPEDLTNEAFVASMDYREFSEHEEGKMQVIAIICRDKWTNAVAAYSVRANGAIERANGIVECLDSF